MTKLTKKHDSIPRLADMIATYRGKLVLIERLHEPFGLALPGGHVDPGEKPREAAQREFLEETGLTVHGARFLTERRGKRRDPRYKMSVTRAYIGVGETNGKRKDEKGFTKVVLMDPKKVRAFPKKRFAFDHWSILQKYFKSTA
ncbi:MAG TPA: NUDIX domain-containing protein [Candidatus Paceibacterota bacterium]